MGVLVGGFGAWVDSREPVGGVWDELIRYGLGEVAKVLPCRWMGWF